jgi:adenine-specific DNA-methyltransferase
MNGESLNIIQDRLEKLKTDFPEIFTEGKIDIEKFKATFTDDINFNNERYVLNWAGKSDAFKVLQIPTTATLKPQLDDSVNFDTTENIFIEGENLEVLKVLQKSYYGKVKCIIIDPPYNTGNDSFIYPDSFKENKEDYQKRIGEKDEEGYLMKEGIFRKNSKDSGHYHSNWLSMMYPRLFLAKNLLREDGVIFVHIDDNEVHNLRMVMNEIFGEENFVAEFLWKRRQNADSRNQSNVSNDHEYILTYSKKLVANFLGKEIDTSKYNNPDNDPRGPWASIDLSGLATKDQRPNLHYDITDPATNIDYKPNPDRGWSKSKEVLLRMIAEERVLFPKKPEGRPREKKFLKDLQKEHTGFSTWLDSGRVGFTTHGTRDLVDLLQGKFFDFPKPVMLIKFLLNQVTISEDTILDFFAGSGTTAHSVLELNKEDRGNRKFILVQLPEQSDENSEALKAGYKTIADISKERIRRVIKKIEAEKAEERKKKSEQIDFGDKEENNLDLGFKSFKLSPSNFKIWRGSEINEENLVQQLDAFTNPVREGSEKDNMLYELMIKAGYLLTDKVEKLENFYSIKNGELLIAIESINQATVDKMIALQPKKIITLDILFKDNDQLKTNTVLQMKDEGIDFKTI